MSAVEKIRAAYRAALKKARQGFEATKATLKRDRDRKIKDARSPARPTVMYDSIDPGQIPVDAPAAAGYVGGSWPTFANGSLRRRCPHAKLLSIAVASRYDAECLDVEPGDATPADAPAWVKRQIARGVKRPVVYSSVSQMAGVQAALAKAGIKRGEYRIWTAHYTGRAHLCGPSCGFGFKDHADATQWTDKAQGRNLDQSQLTANFFN